MANRSSLALAFGIGVVAGLRSMTAPAALGWAAGTDRIHLRKSPISFLTTDKFSRTAAVLALGEMVADKTPWIPSRLAPASLSWRLISGGFCGAAISLSAGENLVQGAAMGALGALIGSLGGYSARRASGSVASALLEDGVAVATAGAVLSSVDKLNGASWLPRQTAA